MEETLKVLLWGLVPQLPLRRGSVGVRVILLAVPPWWGGVTLGGLVAPLAEALLEFLDLTAFGGAVVGPRVNKTRPGVGMLFVRALAAQVLAPGRSCRSDRSPSLRLVHVAVLLVFLLAATRGSDTGAPRVGKPSLRGRVPCTALCGPGVLVRQGEQGGDSFHLVCQHLLVTDPLSESRDNRCIGNTWNGSMYLGEAGGEGPVGFPGLLPHSVEVGLHAMLLIRAGEVCRELRVERSPGLDGSSGEVHEPRPGWPGQGYMEVTCHNGIVTPSRRDVGDVDLQEF
jgi:hypothetical protein